MHPWPAVPRFGAVLVTILLGLHGHMKNASASSQHRLIAITNSTNSLIANVRAVLCCMWLPNMCPVTCSEYGATNGTCYAWECYCEYAPGKELVEVSPGVIRPFPLTEQQQRAIALSSDLLLWIMYSGGAAVGFFVVSLVGYLLYTKFVGGGSPSPSSPSPLSSPSTLKTF